MASQHPTGNIVSRKNRARILEVAREVLSDDPEASMDDIARAAQLARRTVYGHFASRDALLEAIAINASEELIGALGVLPPEDQEPTDTDPRLDMAKRTLRIWTAGLGYRLLISVGRRKLGEEHIADLIRPIRDALTRGVRRGQDLGHFVSTPSPEVLAAAVEAASFPLLAEGCDGPTAARLHLQLLGVPSDEAARIVVEAGTALEAA